jgi:hypothetical protein
MVMPAKIQPGPVGALTDPATQPTETQLKSTLGAAFARIERLTAALRAARPVITWEWKFSDRSGWHRICLLKQRRLFYLLPQAGGFRLSLIVGDRALADLAAGPRAAAVQRRLKAALRYPEGTAFIFTAGDFDAPVVLALIEAKIAH